MSLSIKDIAKLANVSAMTVSRAINSPDLVKPETCKRINEIIEKFGYQQNTFAKALSTGRTYNIGLLIVYDIHMFPEMVIPPVLKGASDIFSENHYNLMLLFDRHDGHNNILSQSDLSAEKLDGIIILSVDSDLEAAYKLSYKIGSLRIPTVIVNQKLELENVSYVTADDFGGGFMAAKYIIEKGHRKIGIIGGSDQFYTSKERLRGYKSAFAEYEINFDKSCYADGNFTADGGYEAMQKLLDNNKDLTAVLCASDLMAFGAINKLRESGLNIPGDISIVGYDDREFASMLTPSLTTIRKDRELMGREAANIIMDQINGGNFIPRKLLLQTEVIERDSVKTI
jgi:DNA-binding LacI/PurR family transcriptional regulator